MTTAPVARAMCIQLPSSLADEHRQLLKDLFDWLVQPCLDYVRLHCKTLLSCSSSHLVVMLIRLYHSLLDEIIASAEMETMTLSQVCFSPSLCPSVCLHACLSCCLSLGNRDVFSVCVCL